MAKGAHIRSLIFVIADHVLALSNVVRLAVARLLLGNRQSPRNVWNGSKAEAARSTKSSRFPRYPHFNPLSRQLPVREAMSATFHTPFTS